SGTQNCSRNTAPSATGASLCRNFVFRAYGWKNWAFPPVYRWISGQSAANSSSHQRTAAMGRLVTDNPELLLYTEGTFHVTVLGGIKLTGLDRLRVTLKLTISGKTEKT